MPNFRGWWDYYFLRYLVGTVVGAAVVFLLPPSPAILRGLACCTDAEWKLIAALSALGFGYCYIASAPMLTVHVTRVYLTKPRHAESAEEWRCDPDILVQLGAWCVPILEIAGAGYLIFAFGWSPRLVGLALFCLILSLQIIFLGKAYRDKFARLTAFYWELSGERAVGAGNTVGEYVESYRHMREHSNAYAIIIFEILLVPVLISTSKLRQLALIAFMWLLPPACCWFIGTLLETKLAQRKRS